MRACYSIDYCMRAFHRTVETGNFLRFFDYMAEIVKPVNENPSNSWSHISEYFAVVDHLGNQLLLNVVLDMKRADNEWINRVCLDAQPQHLKRWHIV